MTAKLRLGPIPKTDTVKLTITLQAALKADLDRYAELHAQDVGRASRRGDAHPAYARNLHRARPRISQSQSGTLGVS